MIHSDTYISEQIISTVWNSQETEEDFSLRLQRRWEIEKEKGFAF